MRLFRIFMPMALLLATLPTTALAAEDWEFELSPLFLWGLSIDADAEINGQGAQLDLDFRDDLLENMEAVFTVHFEARKGAWGYLFELQYVDIEPEVEVQSGPVNVQADVDFEELMIEAAGTWAFRESDQTRWELLAGIRYIDDDINVDVKLNSPLPPIPSNGKVEGGDDWWHPMLGLRVGHKLSEKWSVVGRGDVGYGGSDNSAYNLAIQLRYRFNDWGSAFFGGRYLYIDYDEDDFVFDGNKAGPLAGITLHF